MSMYMPHWHVYMSVLPLLPAPFAAPYHVAPAVDHFFTSIEELRLGMALAERQKRARQEKSNKERVAQAICSL